MMKTIKGKKYDFKITCSENRGLFCFYIRAICKSSGRTSCINNLNAILSEFDIDGNDPKAADSTWMLSKIEAHYFVGNSKQFLTDTVFRNYLEKRLDEDRRLGEWENIS